MQNVYKFVSHEISPVEENSESFIYQAREKLNSGVDLTKEEKRTIFNATYNQNGAKNVGLKLMGWMFLFPEIMKKYWVKTKYYGILEIFAPDKTAIRKEIGQIIKIVEVEK